MAWSTPSGTVGTHLPHTRHRLGEPSSDNRLGRRAGPWRLARQHLIEDGGERVEVGSGIDRLVARGLLRAHVGRRANGEPSLGQRLLTSQCPGDTEVGYEGRAVFGEKQVLRLDVAMDDAVVVGVVHRPGGLDGNAERVVHRKLALAAEPVAQRFPLDIGHGEPELPGRFPGIEDRQNVGMLEPGGEADLPLEPLGAQDGRKLRQENLECDGPVVPQVLGEIHRSHAAPAELALEGVAVGQRVTNAFRHSHAGTPGSRQLLVTGVGNK
jgi:hypothetical protein